MLGSLELNQRGISTPLALQRALGCLTLIFSQHVKTHAGHFKIQRYDLFAEECSKRLLTNYKQSLMPVHVSGGSLKLTLRQPSAIWVFVSHIFP